MTVQVPDALPELRNDPYVGKVVVAVIIAIFNGGKVALFKRKKPPYEGYWEFMGGKVEPGETMEQAARRELFEEAGMTGEDVESLEFVKHLENILPNYHRILFCFLCKTKREKLEVSEHDEWGWFDPSEIPSPVIPLVLEELKLSLNLKHRANELP